MERKTKVNAEDGKHDLLITREFDLPVELLFKAHVEPGIFEQWMSHEYGTTKLTKFEGKKHGNWRFQTTDANGNVLYAANGVFHELVPNQKITRTFEAENSTLDVQLEFLEFEKLTDNTSKLIMHTVFRSVALRDQLLKMPFEYGLNMAHNRLQDIVSKLTNA
ncbi:SRPBCC domain-containing protein [Negadavirga shengliensis]|uniref:SRPBCC domain-containing protein n=1 Tax=Negadavirga shengliensis TaxID=1389218 RepID=A0ABV9T4R7_9BACT